MNIKTDISQRLLISLILFLFFVADLLKAINNKVLYILLFAFVNNTYILIYKSSTEYNYRIFKRIYKKYKEWSKRHSTKFSLKKYKLIYFAKRLKDFNMQAIIKISRIKKITTNHIKILKI